jgi:hypothetical protein
METRRALERIWILLPAARSGCETPLEGGIRHGKHMLMELGLGPKRVNVYLYIPGGILLFSSCNETFRHYSLPHRVSKFPVFLHTNSFKASSFSIMSHPSH